MSQSTTSSLKVLLLVLFAIGPVVCWLAPRLTQKQKKESPGTIREAKVDKSVADEATGDSWWKKPQTACHGKPTLTERPNNPRNSKKTRTNSIQLRK